MKPIQQALQKVIATEQEVLSLLKQTHDHVHITDFITTNFRQIKERLQLMGATLEGTEQRVKSNGQVYGPITNWMGKPIEKPQSTSSKDLSPDEKEKQVFFEKLGMLWDKFHELPAEVIIRDYKKTPDEIVLRGVARKAGVDGFDSKEINVAFIDEIRTGIELKNEEKKQKAVADSGKETKETIVLTQQLIDADPELQKWKAKPGDTLIVRVDGKRRLQQSKQSGN